MIFTDLSFQTPQHAELNPEKEKVGGRRCPVYHGRGVGNILSECFFFFMFYTQAHSFCPEGGKRAP